MIKTALISSLEKCFLDQQVEDFAPLTSLSVLQNERFSLQLIHRGEVGDPLCQRFLIRVDGALAPYATLRNVRNVPVDVAIFQGCDDGNYLRTAPGLYPDLLMPIHYGGAISVMAPTTTFSTTCR